MCIKKPQLLDRSDQLASTGYYLYLTREDLSFDRMVSGMVGVGVGGGVDE